MSTPFSKFSAYTMTQLNEILEDDVKLSNMVQEMDEMQEVQQSKEKTLVNNRTLAEQNLALHPILEHKKEQLTKCYSSLQESFESYQLRKSTFDHKSGNTSLDTLLALLQAEGAKIEEETENMADSFLDGDMTLDSFIDSYHSKRKLAHLRRVKIEKLQEMVLKGQRLPQASVTTSRSQDVSAASLLTDNNNSSPLPQPRRKPPAPPSQPPPSPNPVPATTADPQPPVFYSASPYPPIPPRTGQPFPNVPSGYPSHFLSQYPPALPQRPPPRMTPQPGFIMQ